MNLEGAYHLLAASSSMFALIGLASLPLVSGCSHESVASPVNPSSPPASVTNLEDQQGHDVAARSSDDSGAQNSGAAQSEAESSSSSTAAPTESSSKAPPAGQRPPADRAPTRPGDAEKITWDDLNLGMQADVVFRPFMISDSDRVKELEGKKISIVGYMHGGQAAQKGIKEFILLKNTQCKFGPGGQADHLANVILRADHSTQFSPSPVKVEGTLKIAPFQGPDGNTWSIFRLEDAQIR